MDSITKTKISCPIAVELTIPENELIQTKDEQVKGFFSEVFDASSYIPGVKYSIGIYPNSFDQKGETWIYFELDYSTMIKIEANIIFKIESANYSDERIYVFERFDCIGEKLCTTAELFEPENRYIVDGKLTLKMEGTLMVEKEEEILDNKSWECTGNNSSDDTLGLALWKQENKDFTIVVGENKITAHKCVLSARSSVFTKMFESGMKEAKENKIEIKDFSFKVVETAIKLLYHRNLAPTISLEDKMKMLQFFEKYDIQELKDKLETYLITVINEITVCRLVNASLLSNAIKLEKKCAEFLRDCLQKKKPIAEFDFLDKDFAFNLLKNAFCPVSAPQIVYT